MLEWIWDDEIWFKSESLLIDKVTWKDLENQPGAEGYYPDVRDLHWSFLLGIVLLGVRYTFDRLLVEPLARCCGVSVKPRPPFRENQILEQEFKKNRGTLDYTKIQTLSKQTDLTSRQIEIWFRKRKQKDAPTPLKKIKDCSWHFLFYGAAFTYGAVMLWKKSWLWETKQCWVGWPRQYVESDVYWYYVIELAFYWSLVFTIFTDHKRKDFTEMMIHHVATILLMYFSWMCNFVRAGTLVLLVHDAADPWLAFAKMCKYAKFEKACDTFFVIFFVIWVVSRLFIYPFYVLYSTTVEPYHVLIKQTFFTHWIFNVLLYTLMVLHILWSITIFGVLYKSLRGGKTEDVRSDLSDALELDSDDKHITNGEINGNTNRKPNGTNGETNGASKISLTNQ